MEERERALFSNLKVESFRVAQPTYMRSPDGNKDVGFNKGAILWSIKCGDLWYEYAYQSADYAQWVLDNLTLPGSKHTFAGLMQTRFSKLVPTKVARPRIGMK